MNIEESIKRMRILTAFFLCAAYIDSHAEKVCSERQREEWEQSAEICTSFIVYPYDGGYNIGGAAERGERERKGE